MRHFPVFLDLKRQRVVISGAGAVAAAKLRLLLKTDAVLHVFGESVGPDVARWAGEGALVLHRRTVTAADLAGARLVYAANDDLGDDARVKQLAVDAGILANVVDNLDASDFITPAIVDRTPVTVAIGTEGTAPVLARQIKADVEARLPSNLGVLARISARFRNAAERVPAGRARRSFWSKFFGGLGQRALEQGGEAACANALEVLLTQSCETSEPPVGRIVLVGAGPGDPDLLTIKARRILDKADVILHDRLVDPRVLELARREAIFFETGKQAGAPSWSQADIDAAAIAHAKAGHLVVRLKSGDPMIFGRADEELDAYEAAGISCEVVPGITSAIAAAARTGRSLTRRDRNSGVSFLTAQDLKGYAEHDWRSLAAPGATAAIYMGVKAARFVQGRLLLHGAAPETPVTVVENISRADEHVVSGTLADLKAIMIAHAIQGPAIIFIGIAARNAASDMEASAPVLPPQTSPSLRIATGG